MTALREYSKQLRRPQAAADSATSARSPERAASRASHGASSGEVASAFGPFCSSAPAPATSAVVGGAPTVYERTVRVVAAAASPAGVGTPPQHQVQAAVWPDLVRGISTVPPSLTSASAVLPSLHPSPVLQHPGSSLRTATLSAAVGRHVVTTPHRAHTTGGSFTLLPAWAVAPSPVATMSTLPLPVPPWPLNAPVLTSPLTAPPAAQPSLLPQPQLQSLHGGGTAGPLLPLLSPVVASRTVRELASICAVLRPLPSTATCTAGDVLSPSPALHCRANPSH